MKQLIIFISLISISLCLKAQVKPNVINSVGGSAQYSGGYLAYSVGEAVVGTAVGTNSTITQGFLQTWQSLARNISLNLYLEGLFDLSTHKMNEAMDGNTGVPQWGYNIADRIQVDLFEEIPPYNPLGVSISGIDLSTDGLASFQISSSHNGNYYIRVHNRNHLETWSSIAVPFNTSSVNYNFTTSMLQAFGTDAQVMVEPGKYAFYAGDLDQNGWVDADDFNLFEPALTIGAIGFLPSDFNGSGWVDADDFNIFEPRLTSGVASQTLPF